ncbi:MAG: hypothetical protein AAGD10_01660 [Myxococcota bacterium]
MVAARSFSGRLGFDAEPGVLSVVLARAATGRTTFLVHLGAERLMAEGSVLHAAVADQVDDLRRWYEAALTQRGIPGPDRARLHRRLLIQTPDRIAPELLEGTLRSGLEPPPSLLLLDGFDWAGNLVERAGTLGGLIGLARPLSAELWLTATVHVAPDVRRLAAPVDRFDPLITRAVDLAPRGEKLVLRHLRSEGQPLNDEIDVAELPLGGPEFIERAKPLPAGAYTLLSGGAEGAEALFGACAQSHGVQELNFSFAGRRPERTRGLVELSAEELRQGEVARGYIEQRLARKFPNTPNFQALMQTIWHQVATAGEVFIVGLLLPDGSVNGGTGWAAELAKHFHKPVHVFDQGRGHWLDWTGDEWRSVEPPRITHARFTGTGTRYLNPAGREAIEGLFTRTFG